MRNLQNQKHMTTIALKSLNLKDFIAEKALNKINTFATV